MVTPVQADYKDDAFLSARDAFRAGDHTRFDKNVAIVGADYPMTPYLDIWRFKLTLSDKKAPWPEAPLTVLTDKYPGTLAIEQLRREWLLQLAKKEDWDLFKKQWTKLVSRDEPGLQCLLLAQNLADGLDVTPNALPMLLSPKELPEACVLLGERLLANNKISLDDLTRRIRVLLEANQKATANLVYDFIADKDPTKTKALPSQWSNAIDKPSSFLSRLPAKPSPAQQDLAAYGVSRIARDSPDEAADWLTGQLSDKLNDNSKAWAWSQVGLNGSRKWHPKSLEWFANSTQDVRSDEANEWYVRAALIRKNWPLVQKTIESMSVAQRNETTWIYWLGRAKQAQGDVPGARKLFAQSSNAFTFYGHLSQEELGYPVRLPAAAAPVTETELKLASATPGLQRALIWYQLGQRTEGNY